MDLTAAFVSIILVNLVAWATPGPNMLVVASVAVANGRALGMATGTGLACSALLWSGLAVIGASVLLEAFPDLAAALRLAGALYLVWLGVKSLRVAVADGPAFGADVSGGAGFARAFRIGFLVGMTNPKALIFFGAIVTSFIPPMAPSWFLALVVVLCGALGVLLHSVTATVFSTRRTMRVILERRRPISAVIGLLFCGFGALVAYDAVQGWLSTGP